jgi:hypothetical protein
MRLYYMTSARWSEVILRERRLKLSRFHEANDPFELRIIDSRSKDIRRICDIIATYHEKNTGMICLSDNWRSPVMWAHYAEKHTGICLGFDVEDAIINKVTYTDEKLQVEFGPHLPKYGLTVDLLNKVISTKATDWAYEREHRIMGALKVADPKTKLFYHDFGRQVQLRDVILGHRCSWTPKQVEELVGGPVATVRVCKARPAFGRFEMVEDQRFKAITVKPT